MFPLKHARVALHVIFSMDGTVPIPDADKMHRWRRSFCKSWRNARWRDMLLAFLAWWGSGSSSIQIATSPSTSFILEFPPIDFISTVKPGYDERTEDEPVADEDETDDLRGDESFDGYDEDDEPDEFRSDDEE